MIEIMVASNFSLLKYPYSPSSSADTEVRADRTTVATTRRIGVVFMVLYQSMGLLLNLSLRGAEDGESLR